MDPEEGADFNRRPQDLALSLAAFELAWVDGGAATASWPASWPSRITNAPADRLPHYMSPLRTSAAGRRPQALARAFVLTEPIPTSASIPAC